MKSQANYNTLNVKTLVADTPQYKIEVLPENNRAYLTIVGFWRNPEAVSEYLNDWKHAIKQLENGFTLLTDARDMKIHPTSVRPIHEQAQNLIIEAGIRGVAEVQGSIAEVQLDSVSAQTQMPKRNFTNPDEAEKWLDSL
ncbi:MAG: hypothetical protein AAF632_26435 [Bacteroidota bacterium]